MPAFDPLHQPGLADGGGHHGIAAAARSRRSRAVRFLALPHRHDERLRLRPRARRQSMSAQGALPSTRPGRRLTRVAVAALVAAAAACGYYSGHYVVAQEASADAAAVAQVRLARCGDPYCQSLWVGQT